MDTTTTPQQGISRSGLILGAAGIAGAAALAGLPGVAGAASTSPDHAYGSLAFELEPHDHHDLHHRSHFDRAKAVVDFRTADGKREMNTIVADIRDLKLIDGPRGSREWGGNFGVLFRRTGGAALPTGTYSARVNGKVMPLMITRIDARHYEAVIHRAKPKGV